MSVTELESSCENPSISYHRWIFFRVNSSQIIFTINLLSCAISKCPPEVDGSDGLEWLICLNIPYKLRMRNAMPKWMTTEIENGIDKNKQMSISSVLLVLTFQTGFFFKLCFRATFSHGIYLHWHFKSGSPGQTALPCPALSNPVLPCPALYPFTTSDCPLITWRVAGTDITNVMARVSISVDTQRQACTHARTHTRSHFTVMWNNLRQQLIEHDASRWKGHSPRKWRAGRQD